MSAGIISFDRATVARQFACPDSSRMRWSVFAGNGAQCRGCSAMCGQSFPLPCQILVPKQSDLFWDIAEREETL